MADLTDSVANAGKLVDYSEPKHDYDVLVPWSGGYDSTALILKALEEGKSVTWCAYTLRNNTQQSAAENRARHLITAYLRHRGCDINGCVTDEFDVQHHPADSRYMVPRLIAASTVMGRSAKEIWIGYTRSDCANPQDWAFEDHAALVPIIQALWRVSRLSPVPIVRFPFLDTSKTNMLEYYKKHREVFRHIATCETGYNTPKYCNCNKCRKLEDLGAILNSW